MADGEVSAAAEKCECGADADDINFDRSICACGSMHYFCAQCGTQAEPCADETPTPPAASGLRLAYADPPYPGMAGLYPEDTEVDHAALIARLCEYDGWALSTDERSLRFVLALCPERVRVLAWCRSTAPPFLPYPYAAWEPVLCSPARVSGIAAVRSYIETNAANGRAQRGQLTGQKTAAFCEWVIRCMGATPEDELDDIFPGTGIMGETFAMFQAQPPLFGYEPANKRAYSARANLLRRVADPLPGMERDATRPERRRKVTRKEAA